MWRLPFFEMRHLVISDARKELPNLIGTPDVVQVTRHSVPVLAIVGWSYFESLVCSLRIAQIPWLMDRFRDNPGPAVLWRDPDAQHDEPDAHPWSVYLTEQVQQQYEKLSAQSSGRHVFKSLAYDLGLLRRSPEQSGVELLGPRLAAYRVLPDSMPWNNTIIYRVDHKERHVLVIAVTSEFW